MRDLNELNEYRCEEVERTLYGTTGDSGNGVFMIPYKKMKLYVIASNGHGWDHVSVSAKGRAPTWEEMEHIKRLFFKDDETAMQLHVPPSEHINLAMNALHLWRPQCENIPRPPHYMV